MSESIERRKCVKTSTAALPGIGVITPRLDAAGLGDGLIEPAELGRRGRAPYPDPDGGLFRAPPLERVRIGFVGVGHQGTGHVRNFLAIDGVDIVAICDINPDNAERSRKMVVEKGRPEPRLYTRGPEDYLRLCESDDIDLVFTATPWELHAPVLLAAMRRGKHAATEIPLAVTIDECWDHVETAEETQRQCVRTENGC